MMHSATPGKKKKMEQGDRTIAPSDVEEIEKVINLQIC